MYSGIDLIALWLSGGVGKTITSSHVKGYNLFLKDVPKLFQERKLLYRMLHEHQQISVYMVIDNLSLKRVKMDRSQIVNEMHTPTYSVYGVVKQITEFENILTGVKKEEQYSTHHDQYICSIPVMNMDSNETLPGTFYHKGSYSTILPSETFAENLPSCIVSKGELELRFWSEDKSNSNISQRYSLNYKDNVVWFNFSMFSEEIPVVTLLMAFGLNNHLELLHAVSNDTVVQKMFRTSIAYACRDDDTPLITQDDAISELSKLVKQSEYKLLGLTAENITTKNKLYMESILDNNIFPHIHSNVRRTKALFLAQLVKRLLMTVLGRRSIDNRDSFNFKRLDHVYTTLSQIYHTSYNNVIKNTRKNIDKNIKNNNIMIKQGVVVPLIDNIRFDEINNAIMKVFNVGYWKKNPYAATKTVSESLKNVNNNMEELYIMKKIPSQPGLENNSNKGPRLVHGDNSGYICDFSTPEGKNIGLTPEITFMANITVSMKSYRNIILSLLTSDEITTKYGCIMFDKVPIENINLYGIVYLWGDPILCTSDIVGVYSELRQLRFNGNIPRDHVGIVMDNNTIVINLGPGRLYRPFLVVENNELKLPKAAIERINSKSFSNVEELINAYPGTIEYLDTYEFTMMSLIASSMDDLIEAKNQMDINYKLALEGKDGIPFKEYTHMEIHPIGTLGLVLSTAPFANHNSAPKNQVSCQMRKQAISGELNNNFTNMTRRNVLLYPGRSLVSTVVSRELGIDRTPSGTMAMVAIASYKGFNQEDSILMNQTSIERGFFRATFSRLYTETIDNNTDSTISEFRKPSIQDISSKKNVNYDTLSDLGYSKVGTYVDGDRNDAIINMQIPSVGNKNGTIYKNVETKVQKGETGIVDWVYDGVNKDGNKTIKISVREERIPEIGDKFSSRSGQKGTIGNTYHSALLPFTGNSVADIVLNPHMLPKRMTCGQLIECLASKYGNITNQFVDGTSFQNISVEELMKKMKVLGYDEFGREEMICGFTGRKMEHRIFYGPTYYQRLKHMVTEKVHACGYTAKRTQSTRQPLDGRSRGGAYRIGEMERDALLAHGISSTMKQLFMEHSDGTEYYVCTNKKNGVPCGSICHLYDTTDDGKNIMICPECKSSFGIHYVPMPYTFKSLIQILYGMNIRVRIVC